MLARNEKDLAKSLTSEMLGFGDNFSHLECDTEDGIITREPAIIILMHSLER